MSSELRKKKNKSKYQAWEAMTTEQLISMLGKSGRAKAIRTILRSRINAINVIVPDDQKIIMPKHGKGLPLAELQARLAA